MIGEEERCFVQEQQIMNKVKIVGYGLGLVIVVAVAAWKLLIH